MNEQNFLQQISCVLYVKFDGEDEIARCLSFRFGIDDWRRRRSLNDIRNTDKRVDNVSPAELRRTLSFVNNVRWTCRSTSWRISVLK